MKHKPTQKPADQEALELAHRLGASDVDAVVSREEEPPLKPRVYGEDGYPIVWWSDEFQAQLEAHPKIRELAEKSG